MLVAAAGSNYPDYTCILCTGDPAACILCTGDPAAEYMSFSEHRRDAQSPQFVATGIETL